MLSQRTLPWTPEKYIKYYKRNWYKTTWKLLGLWSERLKSHMYTYATFVWCLYIVTVIHSSVFCYTCCLLLRQQKWNNNGPDEGIIFRNCQPLNELISFRWPLPNKENLTFIHITDHKTQFLMRADTKKIFKWFKMLTWALPFMVVLLKYLFKPFKLGSSSGLSPAILAIYRN